MSLAGVEFSDRVFWSTKLKSEPLLEAICSLDPLAQITIYLRFWEVCTISEIAALLSLDWSVVDQILEESVVVLRGKLGVLAENLSRRQLTAS